MVVVDSKAKSAFTKRAEQIERWKDSLTCKEPSQLKRKSRIVFSDGCVFLAACSAGDREEVKDLLGRGTDIDTANVDGLTALHQACIDNNLDMVEFLVAAGADVNRGDNEGWTPLHATASCGFLSIATFLLDHRADIAAVNNDGELASDVSECNEMDDLLQREIAARQIDIENARKVEKLCMLEDAMNWCNSGHINDRPHARTGATALHVAASKGYKEVLVLLLRAGADVNQQDCDGWTPLHAAAHWAQREACELLADSQANMDIKNCVGQLPQDVADPELVEMLQFLKTKHTVKTDEPCMRKVINSSGSSPTTSGVNKGGRRSSIPRLSQQDKENFKQQAKETIIKEVIVHPPTESDKDFINVTSGEEMINTLETGSEISRTNTAKPVSVEETVESGEEVPVSCLHPRISEGKDDSASEMISEDPLSLRRAKSVGSDEKFYAKLAALRHRIQANSLPSLNKCLDNPPLRPLEPNTGFHTFSLLRPHRTKFSTSSLPRQPRPKLTSVIETPQSDDLNKYNKSQSNGKITPKSPPSSESTSTAAAASVTSAAAAASQVTKDGVKQHPDQSSCIESHVTATGHRKYEVQPFPVQSRRSFVPPVRDEEHEIQRKAHAKRVRETRRSTQGITLEELKSAEQLVKKKKQQQENAVRNSEPQPLINSSPTTVTPGVETSVCETPTSPSVTIVKQEPTESNECKDDQIRIQLHSLSQTSPELKATTRNPVSEGEQDFKKLWEESQVENASLRLDMNSVRSELESTRQQLEQVAQELEKNGLTEIEEREKALDTKIKGFEENVKALEQVKNDNQRLREENGALIRVIAKLSK